MLATALRASGPQSSKAAQDIRPRDLQAQTLKHLLWHAQTQGAASTEAPRLAGRKLLVSEGGTTTCVHCMPMAVLKRKEKKQEAANVYRAGEKRNDAGGRERRWRVRTT
eukprot:scaffold245755_cov15-Tisochrysis_lutea.AAC.1